MTDIVLASSNLGKMAEIRAVLRDTPITLIPQSEFDISDVEESGMTFVENAIIKARHAAKVTGLPAIADDSGLVVDVLGGLPGIYSARYAGDAATDLDRIKKLLQAMDEVDVGADRTAAFYAATVFMKSANDPMPVICEGIWYGSILLSPRGTGGFGYDPIFYVPDYNCSAAELSESVKNSISHRGQALIKLAELFK